MQYYRINITMKGREFNSVEYCSMRGDMSGLWEAINSDIGDEIVPSEEVELIPDPPRVVNQMVREFKSDEIGERFKNGMSLSDALNFDLRDGIKRVDGKLTPDSMEMVRKMKKWVVADGELEQENWWLKMLDALDVKEEKARRAMEKCFKTSVERALVDEGEMEGDAYKLEYKARKGWKKIEDQGFGVKIDLDYGLTSLRNSDGRRTPRVEVDRLSADGGLYDKMIRRFAGVGIASATAAVLLEACAAPVVFETAPVPTDVIVSPTAPGVDVINPQTTATEAVPQVTPTYVVEAAGGSYTEAQLALNNSESAIKQIEAQDRYLEYWAKFENRPFDPDTVELKRKFVYDDPNNPTEVLVLLEALGEYNGRTFTVRIEANGQFAEFPPEVSGDYIELGLGPLELSAGADGQSLSVENGIPVRRNSAGEIVERLNMETKQWVVEASIIEVSITQFLGAEGDYSDEVLERKIFLSPGYVENVEDDLGITYDSEKRAYIQGVLLGTDIVDSDDEYGKKVVFWLGTKNPNGDRVVYAFHYDEYNYEFGIESVNMLVTSRSTLIDNNNHNRSDDLVATSLEEQLAIFKQRVGQVMMVGIYYETEITAEKEVALRELIKSRGGNEEDCDIYVEKIRTERQVAANLVPYLNKININDRAGDLTGFGPGGIGSMDNEDLLIFDHSVSVRPQSCVFSK